MNHGTLWPSAGRERNSGLSVFICWNGDYPFDATATALALSYLSRAEKL
jgi:hypothetical protein